jgi:hypothetical protein
MQTGPSSHFFSLQDKGISPNFHTNRKTLPFWLLRVAYRKQYMSKVRVFLTQFSPSGACLADRFHVKLMLFRHFCPLLWRETWHWGGKSLIWKAKRG